MIRVGVHIHRRKARDSRLHNNGPAPKKQVPVISVLHDHGHPGLCLERVTYTSRRGRRSVLVELSMCGEKILVYLAAR